MIIQGEWFDLKKIDKIDLIGDGKGLWALVKEWLGW